MGSFDSIMLCILSLQWLVDSQHLCVSAPQRLGDLPLGRTFQLADALVGHLPSVPLADDPRHFLVAADRAVLAEAAKGVGVLFIFHGSVSVHLFIPKESATG